MILFTRNQCIIYVFYEVYSIYQFKYNLNPPLNIPASINNNTVKCSMLASLNMFALHPINAKPADMFKNMNNQDCQNTLSNNNL